MLGRMGRIFGRMGIVTLSHGNAPSGGGGGSTPTYYILGF